jgi:hypothetical protein
MSRPVISKHWRVLGAKHPRLNIAALLVGSHKCLHLTEASLQVADFLEADISVAALQLCSMLDEGHRSFECTWALLQRENAHVREMVLTHHTQICSCVLEGVSSVLGTLPLRMRAHALRMCVQRGTATLIGSDSAFRAPWPRDMYCAAALHSVLTCAATSVAVACWSACRSYAAPPRCESAQTGRHARAPTCIGIAVPALR